MRQIIRKLTNYAKDCTNFGALDFTMLFPIGEFTCEVAIKFEKLKKNIKKWRLGMKSQTGTSFKD